MNKEEKENIISKVKFILQGIDQAETDSKEGWWETSTGASFGEEKLAKIIQAIEEESIIKPGQPEEVKSLPSAEAELLDNKKKAILHNALAECYNIHNIKISEKYTPFLIVAMESYKTLCVEQERKAWEKEKEELEKTIDRLNDAINGF